MVVLFPKSNYSTDGDLIALVKDHKFIGYGEIMGVLDHYTLVKVDKGVSKILNELFDEDIPFDIQIE